VKQKNNKQWLRLLLSLAALAFLASCDLPEEDYKEDDLLKNVVKISQLTTQ
jgi:hypothetical protein